jgi:hypothetical protein
LRGDHRLLEDRSRRSLDRSLGRYRLCFLRENGRLLERDCRHRLLDRSWGRDRFCLLREDHGLLQVNRRHWLLNRSWSGDWLSLLRYNSGVLKDNRLCAERHDRLCTSKLIFASSLLGGSEEACRSLIARRVRDIKAPLTILFVVVTRKTTKSSASQDTARSPGNSSARYRLVVVAVSICGNLLHDNLFLGRPRLGHHARVDHHRLGNQRFTSGGRLS